VVASIAGLLYGCLGDEESDVGQHDDPSSTGDGACGVASPGVSLVSAEQIGQQHSQRRLADCYFAGL
jgi:hypothetical protein